MTASASRLGELLQLATGDAPEARSALLRGLFDFYLEAAPGLTPTEREQLDGILYLLARKAAPALRREIAERVADAPSPPRGLVLLFAHDDIHVAEPVLRRSAALSDADLIGVIDTGALGCGKAIARRRQISEAVVERLCEKGDQDALVSLLNNQGAQFSLRAIHGLVQEARRREALQAPLTGRHDLPPQYLTQLYFFAPQDLKKAILDRADYLDPSLVEVAVTANRRRIYEQASREAEAEHSDAKRFVVDQIRAGSIDESMLKTLILEKQYTEFLFAFAWRAGVDLAAAQTILKDRTFESLAIVCRAAGVAPQTFAKIVFSLRRDSDTKSKALRILDIYNRVPPAAAEHILRFWRMRTKEGRDAAFMRYDHDGDAPFHPQPQSGAL